MKKPLIASGLLLLTAANTALAHPGHDHSDWSSPLVHTLFYGAIAAVIGTAFFVIRQSRHKRQTTQQKED
ncbi:hypothetical protein FBG13_01430 [Cobetia marina]|uniref:Uncharacterized protein n=1 Tax=Cobetia marina TaxID=28258 RepID=A0ABU9GJS7_COBMA|nr:MULTISPECIES: hypothetical protein [Cobetia]MDH2291282.1 hypothetical protein [Cobetia sp. 10Alg 146]MDO6788426.1 hypothetical protein [Cobetia marina]MDO6814492.1 hypothetical protein [Cobetia amphilecti]TKD63977.1 hypothetical protein FBG13_01430 [Cobetia marina]GED41892.1 hypothetical protein HHA02_12210 [Cobetia marina]